MTTSGKIGVFSLAMMNVAAAVNLAALPVEAEYGLTSGFYYILAAIVFLIPVALVAAELASLYQDKQGGVFRWVGEAFGPRWGLVAIWMNWLMSLMWYPTVLTFASVAIAYIGFNRTFDHQLASDRYYVFAILVLLFWLATFIASKGLKWIEKVTKLGVTVGVLVPTALLIFSALVYLIAGGSVEMDLNSGFIPDLGNIDNLVLASSIFLYYSGMEMSSVHIKDIDNPRKNYPKAIFIGAIISISVFIFGTYSLAIIIPHNEISLTQSLLIAFDRYADFLHVTKIASFIAILLVVGVLSEVLTWVNGPSKGLLAVGRAGFLPRFFQKTNKNGIQTNILLLQGGIVTAISFLFVVMPSVQAFYQLFAQLAVIMYLTMYMLMFASAIVLRYSQKNQPRTFRIGKKGNSLMWIISGVGFLGALAAFFLSFFPPNQITTGSDTLWFVVLICGYVIAFSIPLIIYSVRKNSWKDDSISKENEFQPFQNFKT